MPYAQGEVRSQPGGVQSAPMKALRILAMLACPLSLAMAQWHWISPWLILPTAAVTISSVVVAIRDRNDGGSDGAPSLNLNH